MQDWAANPEKDAEDREQEEAEKEMKLEKEDDETIQRMRAMDEWKDGRATDFTLRIQYVGWEVLMYNSCFRF